MLQSDPGPVTEEWDATQVCVEGESILAGLECREVMAKFTEPHRSQENDMSTIRRLLFMIDEVYLRRTDPFTERLDPFEPVGE